jgi:hypothetical protein
MSIQLTEAQQQALQQEQSTIVRVVDPRTNTTYVLLSEKEYESIRAILEDERQQRAIHAVGLRNAAGRMDEAP